MIAKLLSTYGFYGLQQFVQSMMPSVKYNFTGLSVGASFLIGTIAHWLGLTPLIVVAMAAAVFAEMGTGIKASNVAGIEFESFKFSRGILKICVWCVIFFVFHSFAVEMTAFGGWPYLIAASVFQILHVSSMGFFAIENGTSILENLAVIDGKPKTQYIEAVKEFWTAFVDALKNFLLHNKNKRNNED